VIRTMLKSKIHRVNVTQADLHYKGSVTIEGERGSGEICINGAAAHLMKPGDTVIIASFVGVDNAEAPGWKAKRVFVDGQNKIRE
jgi:aspartate 1-decarboxylase